MLTGMTADCTLAVCIIEGISIAIRMFAHGITKFTFSGCTVPFMDIFVNRCILSHFFTAYRTLISHQAFFHTGSFFYSDDNDASTIGFYLCMIFTFLKSTYFAFLVFIKIMATAISADRTFSCLRIKCGMITVFMVTGSITNRTFSCFAVPYMGCFGSCFRHFCTTDSTDITYLSLLFTCCFY